VIFSCEKVRERIEEPVKKFTGAWKITKVVRNESDITEWVDPAQFRLTLNEDNTYTISNNNIPFVANTNGTWSIADPAYPFQISFKAKDSANAVSADMLAPVEKGKRNIVITFSPGCRSNKYVYTLESLQ
jgi:Domain of unknown function (DUF5004)